MRNKSLAVPRIFGLTTLKPSIAYEAPSRMMREPRVVRFGLPLFFVGWIIYVARDRFAYHDAKRAEILERRRIARERAEQE